MLTIQFAKQEKDEDKTKDFNALAILTCEDCGETLCTSPFEVRDRKAFRVNEVVDAVAIIFAGFNHECKEITNVRA
jgi:hypothetical protein